MMGKTTSCRISRWSWACACVVGLLHVTPASAGDVEYLVFPYLWTSGMDAETGAPRRTTQVDVSFSDYAEFIDVGAAVVFEAEGEKWSFISDLLAVRLTEDVELPLSTADFEQKQLIVEVGLGYRPNGWKAARILVGARYMNLDTTIVFRDRVRLQIGQSFVDPFVGVDWKPRRGKWELLLQTDIGGGVDADFSWAGIVGSTYHFSERFGIGGGYRLLDVDFEDEEFVFDGRMEGLQLGLTIEF